MWPADPALHPAGVRFDVTSSETDFHYQEVSYSESDGSVVSGNFDASLSGHSVLRFTDGPIEQIATKTNDEDHDIFLIKQHQGQQG